MDEEFKPEVRAYKRFDSDADVKYSFMYELDTEVHYQRIEEYEKDTSLEKYLAKSKNISSKGLCLRSPTELNKGDRLLMELILPGLSSGIMMEGEVRWSQKKDSDEENLSFEAGIEISSVKGKPVSETIYYDQEYHVYWSLVLEEVLGSYKDAMYKRKK